MLSSAKEFTKGFFSQLNVINALILRETRTRFGKHSLGYLWAFVEPLAWIGTFLILFSLGNRQPPDGMDPVGFLATGMLPYIMFRGIMSKSMSAIKGNKALLYYPQVRPLDLVGARTILESATFSVIFVVFIAANTFMGVELQIDSLLKIILGFLLTTLLASGLGLVFSSLTAIFQTLENLIGPILRPLLWISGVFFSAKELPVHVREMLLYNPILHLTELIRNGFFKSYTAEFYDYNYLAWWIIGSSFLGLLLERVTRRKLEG